MSVDLFYQRSKNPDPVNIEDEMHDVDVRQDIGDQPPELAAPDHGGFKKPRDIHFGPPGNGYPGRQPNSSRNHPGAHKFFVLCRLTHGPPATPIYARRLSAA